MIDAEKIARILYDCEKARAESARSVLAGSKPSGCEGILIEPYEECAEAFRSDARAVVAAMQGSAQGEPAVLTSEQVKAWRDDPNVKNAVKADRFASASAAPPTSAVAVVERLREEWAEADHTFAVWAADEIIRALREAGHG